MSPQAARKRKISILRAQGRSNEAIRALNEYLEQWVFYKRIWAPFSPPLPLHFLIKRGFAFWLSLPLSPSVTLLLSGKEPNCHFVLQVCGRPGSMAWAVRTLHQRTWVMTIDLLSVVGVFGSRFSIWKQGLFRCYFTLLIEVSKAVNEISGVIPNWPVLSV